MTTFSQLIDEMVVELRRPDMLSMMVAYANQTVRELHFRPNVNSPIKYDANRCEEELTVNTEDRYLWTLPQPARFQDMEAIYVKDIGMYVPRKNPQLTREVSFQPYPELYWYRTGPQIAIAGVTQPWVIWVSYFVYVQALAYQPEVTRVVVYDPTTGQYTLKADGGTPSQAQLDAATHWMLERWAETIKEGVRAKVWKRNGDMDRTRTSYSAYESMRASMWNTEPSS